MKLIKLGLISLVVLFIVATLIGLMLPSTVVVSRATDIQRGPDSIHVLLADLSRWSEWIEGVKANGYTVLTPASTGKGAQSRVNGNTITLTGITPTAVTSTWKGGNGFNQEAVLELLSDSAHTVTTVHWSFTQHIKWYPWERLGSIMNDKILGPVMEKSLDNLKKMAEQQ